MARPLRIEYPGAIYHVTARGNEKRAIWRDDNDYSTFLAYLIDTIKAFRLKLFAYILMPNHYHLLLQTEDANLSRAMHQLNTAYTIYFNRKYKRVGHLFQGRYRALLVQKNPYLLEVSRYVHLNAFRAALVDDPLEYRWSSCGYYIGRGKVPEWLNIDYILEMMAKDYRKRKRAYREFIEDGIYRSRDPFTKIYAQTVLGDENFIDSIKSRFKLKKHQEMPATKKLGAKLSFDDILNTVCHVMQKNRQGIIEGGRFSLERKMTIYLLRTKTDMSLREIGNHFGISYSTVTRIKKTFDEKLKQDEGLKRTIDKINEYLESQISRPDPN